MKKFPYRIILLLGITGMLTLSSCTGNNSQSTPQAPVTPSGVAVKLSADNTIVNAGGASKLSWSSSNATACVASNNVGNSMWSGSKTASSVTSTQTLSNLVTSGDYKLSCSSGNVSNMQSVSIKIIPGGANSLDNITPGQWYEVPNSKMSSVDPCPVQPCSYSGNTGQFAVMGSWSGGVYDTKRDYLVVWGGGHADYAGNEIYVFDVPSLHWKMLTEPSADVTPNVAHYADGKPSSRHTNSSLVYDTKDDSMLVCGVSSVYGNGYALPDSDAYSFTAKSWTSLGVIPDSPNGSPQAIGDIAIYDAKNDRMWCHTVGGSGALWEFNLTTKGWIMHEQSELSITASALYDSKRHRMVAIGGYGIRQVIGWDLDHPDSAPISHTTTGAEGGRALESIEGPGFDYDPVNDVYVGWNGGDIIYTLNPVSWVWTQVNPAVGNSVIPTAAVPAGTYGRFRYIPSKHAFIVVNSTTENVYVLKR